MARVVAPLLLLLVAGCASAQSAPTAGSPAADSHRASPQAPPAPTAPARNPGIPIGVYVPGESASWDAVAAFGQQAGQPVRYVLSYLGPDDPFPAPLAQQAAAHGAELVLQLEPTMSMARVAAGDDDAYLSSLAADVANFAHPVILSWAAEANGDWYQYGAPQTPVADYRAAWAHVMALFRGSGNVTWMDTINRTYDGAAPTSEYVIPGVDLYGIDAYYVSATDTFDSVFDETVRQIRAVTSKPILINETGIGQANNQAAAIAALVQGVRDYHLAALIYFDSNQGTSSPYHQNWALAPAGMKALRDSLASARSQPAT
jgi:mannan endo-1,4-beta-mannosidase